MLEGFFYAAMLLEHLINLLEVFPFKLFPFEESKFSSEVKIGVMRERYLSWVGV